jgi:hypothetical protein
MHAASSSELQGRAGDGGLRDHGGRSPASSGIALQLAR